MTDRLREAATEFVRDYENGDMGDLKHYARALRAALAEAATVKQSLTVDAPPPAAPDEKPALWVRRDHLQIAQRQAFMVRAAPEKLADDYVPLFLGDWPAKEVR